MKFCKRWAVIPVCLAALLSLFGCTVKKPHMADGPGMENTGYWVSFTVSRVDSYAQHNFSITVEETAEGYVVTGNVRDDDGTEYEETEGIPLPEAVRMQLDKLQPHNLTGKGVYPDDPNGPVALDAPLVSIRVVTADGAQLEKLDDNDFSLDVYQLVLPLFREKYN
jgi:hypothetical protein